MNRKMEEKQDAKGAVKNSTHSKESESNNTQNKSHKAQSGDSKETKGHSVKMSADKK